MAWKIEKRGYGLGQVHFIALLGFFLKHGFGLILLYYSLCTILSVVMHG